MGLPKADSSTPGWLKHRLPALKNILDRMKEEEKSILEDEAEKFRDEGLPSDVQRK